MPNDQIMLVSDGIFADDLVNREYRPCDRVGHPLWYKAEHALKMATLNPARYFGLDREIGSITPGRIADILILEDITLPSPVTVIEKGLIAAQDGSLAIESSPFPYVRKESFYSYDKVSADDFVIVARDEVTVPVIDIVDITVTRRIDIELVKSNGVLLPDRGRDVRKAFYSRRERRQWGSGFVRGVGAMSEG